MSQGKKLEEKVYIDLFTITEINPEIGDMQIYSRYKWTYYG